MNSIQKVSALEILDSRGNPTVSVTVSPVERHYGLGGRALGRVHGHS